MSCSDQTAQRAQSCSDTHSPPE